VGRSAEGKSGFLRLFDRPSEAKYDFLLRAVAEPNGVDLSGSYKTIGDETAWRTAQSNDVTPIVAHRLIDALGEEQVPDRWQASHDESKRLLTAYMAELDHVAQILAAREIPLVALKNSGITRAIYYCTGCSPMGDMDVMVRKADFRAAHQVLLDDGYHFEFRSVLEEADATAAERSGGAEYWKVLPSGDKLWFELQWRPVAGRWIRPDQEPSSEDLMGRSIAVEGSAIRVLGSEDNLLQVTLHTAKHSYVRAPGFRLNLDVDRITRFQPVDWDIFVDRVKSYRVKTSVFFALALSQALVGAPVPDEVLDRLAPGRWRAKLITRLLYRAGLFEPEERKFSNPVFLMFNLLLYDDVRDAVRAVFPEASWMRERYGFTSGLMLPAYHARRLANLAFRRTL
jgi:hypothetical protein